jgi:hypothetical protein
VWALMAEMKGGELFMVVDETLHTATSNFNLN